MTPCSDPSRLRLALPKGRMLDGVLDVLDEAGIRVRRSERGYRPRVSLPGVEAKILKPQNIIGMLDAGVGDVGFAGADWVAELGADLVELVDLGLDPVRLVAAAPADQLIDGGLPPGPKVVATEYVQLTRQWIEARGLDARVLRSFGATEVFPPEQADCIVDNTATGATLVANGLEIIDELMTSSTRLYASHAALARPAVRDGIDRLVTLVNSVLEARRRVMIELNVSAAALAPVIDTLPCMREPTVSPLHGSGWYAVKAAIPRDELTRIVPEVKSMGGVDIVVTAPTQIVP